MVILSIFIKNNLFITRTIRALSSSMSADRLALFQGIGLTEQKAKETIKNKALADKLENAIMKVGCILMPKMDHNH